MATRTEIRPIPAQWKYLMKKLQAAGVFKEYIQISFGKCELSRVILVIHK